MIILVAAFNIISSLIMLVKDKTADIAILRTMGATRGMIMRIFFLAGASIGVIGAASGVILAVLFVKLHRIHPTSVTGFDRARPLPADFICFLKFRPSSTGRRSHIPLLSLWV